MMHFANNDNPRIYDVIFSAKYITHNGKIDNTI